MKKIFFIFLLSFSLNLIWENLHSYLYIDYMDGAITEAILLRASIGDAIIITFLSLPFVFVPRLRNKSWLIVFAGILIGIFIELYALHTGRWAYNKYMPIIPILSIGLTPTVQLGILGYFSYRLVAEKTNIRKK